MAAAVRNNVWVAPGQDAQFLHKTTAPLTADGLRGEDHGQVLCNTRDAVPGTSSFHDYNLVGMLAFFTLASASEHRTVYRCLLVWRSKDCMFADQSRKQAVFIERCEPGAGGVGLCVCVL